MLLSLGVVNSAFGAPKEKISDSRDVVEEYFNNMGTDWTEFTNLYTQSQTKSFTQFLNNEDNIRDNIGVLNVKDAKVKDVVEIKYKDAANFLADDYSGQS